MSGRGHNGPGFGGTVGLGVAASFLIGVIAIGHAIFRQLEGAASTILVFAEIALCVILASVAVGALGLLVYRGQLARYHLAERRAEVARLEQAPSWRAEVLEAADEHDAEALSPRSPRPAILGKRPGSFPGRRLEAVPDDDTRGGAS